MQTRQHQRKVVVELSHFMSLQSIIASSDLVATVRDDLAEFFVRQGGSARRNRP